MDVAGLGGASLLDVGLLEFEPHGVRVRDHVQVQSEREARNYRSGSHIRHKHAPVADAARQDRDNLGIGSLTRSVEHHRNEHEQRAEHVYEIRNEVQVVVHDDLLQRRLVLHEIVYLLGNVEYDHDSDYQDKGYEEGEYEALEYVPVQFLGAKFYHNLEVIRGITEFFHGVKSPACMCALAWRTRSR